MDKVRSGLLKIIDVPDLPFAASSSKAINDWILLSILLGTDFLPMLFNISVDKNFDRIIGIYKNELPNNPGYLTNTNGTINFTRVQALIKVFVREKLHFGSSGTGTVSHKDYYKKNFKILEKDRYATDKVVVNYIEGLNWVLQLYLVGIPSWTWVCPHYDHPYPIDLVDAIVPEIRFELGFPLSQYEELVLRLRYESRHILPKPLQKLALGPEWPIADFPKKQPGHGISCKLFVLNLT